MARNTRNKMLSNKYNDIVIKIVVDAIKGGRKSKKSINLTSKTTFKKFIYIRLPNIENSSSSFTFIITFKAINTSIKLSTYIINTSIL